MKDKIPTNQEFEAKGSITKEHDFAKNITEIKGITELFTTAKNISDLEVYHDPFMTEQHKERDQKITTLLEQYVRFYTHKIDQNYKYKKILFWTCMIYLIVFGIAFFKILCFYSYNLFHLNKNLNTGMIVELITLSLSLLSLIFGVLTIITKYLFPQEDEKYITTIVELIQKNDLEHKIANMKMKINAADENHENSD